MKKAKKARAPKVGDEILVISYGQRGTLVKQLKDGRWEAQVGLIKMTLEEKEFNLIKAEKEAAQPKKRQVNVVKRSNTSGPRARLDLRGKRYEEAMQELDGVYRSGPCSTTWPSRYHPRDWNRGVDP